MKIILSLLIFVSVLFSQDEYFEQNSSYQLGEGVQVGTLPLYVGGYFSLDYRYKDESNRYRIDDLALLLYGDYNKFSYLAELEYKEFYTYTDFNNTHTIERDTALHVERLYVDYTFNENYLLRAGKYNSPIGFWNLLPINVLRETTSNPVSTYIIFPKFTTGLYGAYSSYNDDEWTIDVMLQYNDDFDPDYNNYKMDEHNAVGFAYTHDDLTLKLNLGMFDNLFGNGETQHLYYAMASAKYETSEFKITSELGSQRSKEGFTTKYAGYLQGVYHFSQEHAGIVRLESYDEKRTGKQDDIAILGYTYRPLYPVALKGEYQFHTLHDENQLLFSFSVLF